MQNKPPMTPRQRDKLALKIGCGVLLSIVALVVFAIVASAVSDHGLVTLNATPTPTTTPDYALTQTAINNAYATQRAQAFPTNAPTPQPTRHPTHQSTPVPTHQATPRPTPRPTQPPACQAVNGNPWCYNFSPGNYITNPPSNFCNYFNCIASFWNGSGFVNECSDGSYSLSGGHQGDCSHHGGEMRPLYSH